MCANVCHTQLSSMIWGTHCRSCMFNSTTTVKSLNHQLLPAILADKSLWQEVETVYAVCCRCEAGPDVGNIWQNGRILLRSLSLLCPHKSVMLIPSVIWWWRVFIVNPKPSLSTTFPPSQRLLCSCLSLCVCVCRTAVASMATGVIVKHFLNVTYRPFKCNTEN